MSYLIVYVKSVQIFSFIPGNFSFISRSPFWLTWSFFKSLGMSKVLSNMSCTINDVVNLT